MDQNSKITCLSLIKISSTPNSHHSNSYNLIIIVNIREHNKNLISPVQLQRN